jgi:hypothetical protein
VQAEFHRTKFDKFNKIFKNADFDETGHICQFIFRTLFDEFVEFFNELTVAFLSPVGIFNLITLPLARIKARE